VESPLRVLLIEDSANDAWLLERSLRKEWSDLIVQRVDAPEALEEALSTRKWDVVLSDESMPRFSAGAALDILKRRGLELPFIVVSGFLSTEGAVGLMKAGAHDFVRKDDLARLAPAIHREIRDAEVRRRRRQAELAVKESEEKYRRLVESLRSV
jgi:DNA-binding NtrC family response regulator